MERCVRFRALFAPASLTVCALSPALSNVCVLRPSLSTTLRTLYPARFETAVNIFRVACTFDRILSRMSFPRIYHSRCSVDTVIPSRRFSRAVLDTDLCSFPATSCPYPRPQWALIPAPQLFARWSSVRCPTRPPFILSIMTQKRALLEVLQHVCEPGIDRSRP